MCIVATPARLSVLLFEVINGESVIYLTLYKHAWLTITTTATENRIINTTFFWFGLAITLLIFTIFFRGFARDLLLFVYIARAMVIKR